MNNWIDNKCKQFLKDHKALQTGNVKYLRERCMLLEKLIKKDMHRVMSLTMNELRRACVELSVQEGNKDDMIKRVSSVLLNEEI